MSIIVPDTIVFKILLNGIMGFGMLLAVLFPLDNIDNVLHRDTGCPFRAAF